jgi:hypothetical protein
MSAGQKRIPGTVAKDGRRARLGVNLLSFHQASIALHVNSVPLSETIESGLPRRVTIELGSRATRRPEIEVSAIAPRYSLVTS